MSRLFDHDVDDETFKATFDPIFDLVDLWDISLEEAEAFLEDVGYFPLEEEKKSSIVENIETFDELISKCRRSQYHDVAEVLEYLADHETNQYGPVYKPIGAPCESPEFAKRLMWAFKAGRSYQADLNRGDQ